MVTPPIGMAVTVETDYMGPVCFRLTYNLSVVERSEDFLASRFSLLVVQISEEDYQIIENRRDVWWDYRLFPPIGRL